MFHCRQSNEVNVLRSLHSHPILCPFIDLVNPPGVAHRPSEKLRQRENRNQRNAGKSKQSDCSGEGGFTEQCPYSTKHLSDANSQTLDNLIYYALKMVQIKPFKGRYLPLGRYDYSTGFIDALIIRNTKQKLFFFLIQGTRK